MTEPIVPTIVPVNREVPLPEGALTRLGPLYLAAVRASDELERYLVGLCDGLGIDRAKVVSVDADRAVLVLEEIDPAKMTVESPEVT